LAGIEANQKLIALDAEDVQKLDHLAKDGKQRRVNSPPWGTDFVSAVADRLVPCSLVVCNLNISSLSN
jgi:hypothetical protein